MEQTSKSETLHAFIDASKAKGATDDFLVDLLREQGWAAKDIYAAFGRYYQSLTGLPVPVRAGGAGEAARDAFLYLLAFSTLATWTIALGSLVFTYIDRWLPDPLVRRGYEGLYQVSSQMACIIVGFPIYLLVMRFILREVETRPEKLESGIRKWLTYIALLIAAGTVIGDLITFLTFFLQGDLTARFLLKVVTVVVIAGGVFGYYLESLKRGAAREEA
jgi:membrane protein YqaA with SNARE-associated domain